MHVIRFSGSERLSGRLSWRLFGRLRRKRIGRLKAVREVCKGGFVTPFMAFRHLLFRHLLPSLLLSGMMFPSLNVLSPVIFCMRRPPKVLLLPSLMPVQ